MKEDTTEDLANYLVAGLGNIGSEYAGSRHNIGFDILDFFSQNKQITFQKDSKLKGFISRFRIGEKKIFLLKPTTYMNDSGIAVSRVRDYYKIPSMNILIVLDDMDISFGQLRIREEGGTAGHNGLKSIEMYLKTKKYPRFRIGIGRRQGDVTSYVLGKFDEEEKKSLTDVIKQAAKAIDIWITEGIDKAMSFANVREQESKKDEII